MEVRKVLRKATAVAASASFIGATMLGAVAQDLASYPAPFVNNGVFDAFIVVGADAQPTDVVGAVDVGASLQFALKKAVTTTTGASDATIDQGVKIQKSGNKFNYEDTISGIEVSTGLSQDDLPAVLSDGKYVESEGSNRNSVTYTQNLYFDNTTSSSTAKLVYAQDDQLAPKAGDYLYIDRSAQLYNYTLAFDTGVQYDNSSDANAQDDLKTTTLGIQGKTYTITNVALSGGKGKIKQLTLLSGESVLWLTQNNPITKTVGGVEHKVEVLDVTESATACQVKVDDATSIIDVGNTKTVNGVQIGVTDARAIHAQLQDTDVCQISIGASQLELDNGKELKVDDAKVDGTKAAISTTGDGQLNSISVTYKPNSLDNDVYLTAGKEFIDPVFNSWKLVYGGVSASYDESTLKDTSDKRAELRFTNNDGKQVIIPFWMNDSNTAAVKVNIGEGKKHNQQFLLNGSSVSTSPNRGATSVTCKSGTGKVTDCQGAQILGVTSGGEAHVFEISSINFGSTSNTTSIKDVTYGRTFDDLKFTSGSDNVLSLGSFGTITLFINQSSITVRSSVNGKIETKARGTINLNNQQNNSLANTGNVTVTFSELDRNGGKTIPDEKNPVQLNFSLKPHSDNTQIDITEGTDPASRPYSVPLEQDSDFNVVVTRVGTKATVDTNNHKSVVVDMPIAEVYGNVFVAPIVASVNTAGSGVTSYSLSKLNVGAAKLDSEISDATANNLIIVGGPCANKVSAQVLGKTFPACGADSGIAAGTAMIKEVAQSSGKVALVVAGYDALDTRRATRVLANYDQYGLSGSEVTVTGTSLTDIQIKKSA